MKECNRIIAFLPLPNGRFPLTESGVMEAQEEGFRTGWKEALSWTRERIADNLTRASMDDNVACVKSIQHDIETELDTCQKVEYGDGNGYRKVCKDCSAKQACRAATVIDEED